LIGTPSIDVGEHVPPKWEGTVKTTVATAASVVVLGLSLYCGLTVHRSLPSGPAVSGLRFEPAVIDLGSYPWGVQIPFELTLVNAGEKPASGLRARTSCGCTVIELPPGASVPVGGRLSVRGVIDTERAGGVKERYVVVETDRGAGCEARLTVEVVPTYEIDPPKLVFGKIAGSDLGHAIRTFDLRSSRGALVADPEVDVPWLDAWVDGEMPSGERIAVALRPEALAQGKQVGRITLRTNDEYVPNTTVPVVVEADFALDIVPGHLFLQADEIRAVLVLDRTRCPVLIEQASAEDPDLELYLGDTGVVQVRCESPIDKWRVPVWVRAATGVDACFFVSKLSPLKGDS
jgi:hypothetical protein